MITVSACLIVKNEENVLARCLSSLKDLVDEIILVDTGSTMQQKRSEHSLDAKSLILHGWMILPLQEIFLWKKPNGLYLYRRCR